MEDYCIVCAEPLEWVAYGHCGHKDACSKCVTRLRFVLEDHRCVICQQKLPAVFVTRFLGEYTKALPAREFEELQPERKTAYHNLKAVSAYFDDRSHFEAIRKLCSYTHPALTEGQANGEMQLSHFRNLGSLKKALQTHLQLQFCDICLEGRKVFIPEQLLYSKAELNRHQRTGDLEGAMAESGFKGHPLCRYCNRRFFGENELFFHMQQAHEQCHLCKRAQPDKFVYYRDYDELEEHFRHEHFLCGHPSCLEKKFVVFPSEQELKQHNAREHSGSMSRAERRQALTIPIDVQYLRRPVEEPRGSRARPGVRLREPDSQQQLAAAVQASIDTAQQEAQRLRETSGQQAASSANGRRVLDDADFPSMGGPGAAPYAPGPSAAAFAGRAAPRPEDFPALPGTSKAAKRRAKEKEKEQAKTLADRIGRQGDVRVISSGRPAAPREDAFPALGHSASTPHLASSQTQPAGAQWQAASARTTSASPSRSSATSADDFPSLPQSRGPAPLQVPSFPAPAAAARATANATASRRGASGTSRPPSQDEFPALLGAVPAGRGAAPQEQHLQRSFADEAAAGSSAVGGISEGLKAANKILIEKVKRQLDARRFAEFRQEAAKFLHGEINAEAYHQHVCALGLYSLVPEMASLLPDPMKRAELLSVHEASSSSSGRWVPPEAAAAGLRAAKSQGSWLCSSCTLINEPRAATCEACHAKRPLQDLGALARTASANGIAKGDQADGTEAGNKKPNKKVPKFERLRLTSGGQDPAFQAEVQKNHVKPGNVWTQRQTLPGAPGPTPPAKSAWAANGQNGLASRVGSMQDAWAKK